MPGKEVTRRPRTGKAVADDLGADAVLRKFKDHGLVGDKYSGMRELAQGGMGIIFSAHDIGLDRTSVVKVIKPDLARRRDLLAGFIEEARITGQLEHPNIVPVHDIGVLDGERLYFSMKLIEGEELQGILDGLHAGDPAYDGYTLFRLLTIFRKVCDAAEFAHSRGIIHRDIKPDNIMVGRFGEVLLVDWGLARRLNRHEVTPGAQPELSGGIRRQTQDQVVKGTPGYMAPEQALGLVGNIDVRTDIFQLGATLYAIATLEALSARSQGTAGPTATVTDGYVCGVQLTGKDRLEMCLKVTIFGLQVQLRSVARTAVGCQSQALRLSR